MTDEAVHVVPISKLPMNVVLNLRWLIPLCLDYRIKKPVRVLHD